MLRPYPPPHPPAPPPAGLRAAPCYPPFPAGTGRAPPQRPAGCSAFQPRWSQLLIGQAAVPLRHEALISRISLGAGSVIGNFSVPPPRYGFLIGWLVLLRRRCARFGYSASGPWPSSEETDDRERTAALTISVQIQPLSVSSSVTCLLRVPFSLLLYLSRWL